MGETYPQKLLSRARPRQGWRGLARGHRGRRGADHGATPAGAAQGARGRRGGPEKQAGGEAVLAAPQRPGTSPRRDPAQTALARQRCARPGGQQPGGSPQALRTGRAPWYQLRP
jgi:hypothetical protein